MLPLDVHLDKTLRGGAGNKSVEAWSTSAARRDTAWATRTTSASTAPNCFCSMASRTPGMVLTPYPV